MISTLCVDRATRLIRCLRGDSDCFFLRLDPVVHLNLLMNPKCCPNFSGFLWTGKLHAKDTSNVGECNSRSAVTKVWCWKLMCLVVGKNYAKRFVNLWIASWLSWLWRWRWVTLDGLFKVESMKLQSWGETFTCYLSALEPRDWMDILGGWMHSQRLFMKAGFSGAEVSSSQTNKASTFWELCLCKRAVHGTEIAPCW